MTNKKVIKLINRRDELFRRVIMLDLTKEQKHLDDSIEREYWHYGYSMALDDILRNFNLEEKIKEGDRNGYIS